MTGRETQTARRAGFPAHPIWRSIGITTANAMLIGIALFAVAVPAWAQIAPDPGLGKPTPKAGEVTAVKGQMMTIELVSEAKTRAAVVEFLIRDFPKNGKLGQMVSHEEDRTRATIKYTPFADTAATTDSFTFTARYPGGLWSQRVKVSINLEASEPRIHATTEADFGKVMLGQSKVLEIFLSNSGNASYRNQIQLPPPWSMEDPANGLLSLPVGGQRVIKVRYSPEIEGPSKFNLAFFRNKGATTQLRGAGFAPFSVETELVGLKWEEKSRTRQAEITVTGYSQELLPVSVITDDRLRINGGESGFLRPNEPANFQVYLPPKDSDSYEGQIEFVAGDFRIPVKITADIAPGYIVIENTETQSNQLDFGSLKPGDIAQSSFQLHNVGGTTVKLRLGSEAPFTVLAAGGRASLDPQEAEAFAVRVTAPEGIPGPYEGNLRIEADNGQILQLALKAVFQGPTTDPNASLRVQATAPTYSSPGNPPSSPSNVPNSDRPPTGNNAPSKPATQEEHDRAIAAMDKQRSPLGFITYPLVERDISLSIPKVPETGIRLIGEGRRYLTVGWPQLENGDHSFEMEMRIMTHAGENGIAESIWAPYQDVAFATNRNRETTAEIRGLTPNATYEFRVFTLGVDGKVSEPLAFAAKTQMPLDWTWIYISFGIVVLAGLTYVVRRWVQPESTSTGFLPGLSSLRDLLGKEH